MSEKLTRIKLPGSVNFRGLQDWGEKSAEEMISQARKYAAYLRSQADEVDGAAEHHFQIDVIRGPYVQHHVKELQKSSLPSPSTPKSTNID